MRFWSLFMFMAAILAVDIADGEVPSRAEPAQPPSIAERDPIWTGIRNGIQVEYGSAGLLSEGKPWWKQGAISLSYERYISAFTLQTGFEYGWDDRFGRSTNYLGTSLQGHYLGIHKNGIALDLGVGPILVYSFEQPPDSTPFNRGFGVGGIVSLGFRFIRENGVTIRPSYESVVGKEGAEHWLRLGLGYAWADHPQCHDEGDKKAGSPCRTDRPGACSAGTWKCIFGTLVCKSLRKPSSERCNGVDDDCDGRVDEGNPGAGSYCNTDSLGVCSRGTLTCNSGRLTCEQRSKPKMEISNGLDDDCDGQTDEGLPDIRSTSGALKQKAPNAKPMTFFEPPPVVAESDLASALSPLQDRLTEMAKRAIAALYGLYFPSTQGGVASFTETSRTVRVKQYSEGRFQARFENKWDVILEHSIGPWIFVEDVMVRSKTSLGENVARDRLKVWCDQAAAGNGAQMRGTLIGNPREVGTDWEFLSKKTIYEGTCRIDHNVPKCAAVGGYRDAECVYRKDTTVYHASWAIGIECRLSPFPLPIKKDPWECRWTWADELGGSELQVDFKGPQTTTGPAKEAAQYLESEVPARLFSWEGRKATAGTPPDGSEPYPLMACTQGTSRYQQWCSGTEQALNLHVVAPKRTVNKYTYDLSQYLQKAAVYRGLVPHVRARVEWSSRSECWSRPPSSKLWLSFGTGKEEEQRRVVRLSPGEGPLDNVVDLPLMSEDGSWLGDFSQSQYEIAFGVRLSVASEVPESREILDPSLAGMFSDYCLSSGACNPTRIPDTCKLLSHGAKLEFSPTIIAENLSSIQKEVSYLTTIRQQQIDIANLVSDSKRNAVCALAVAVSAARAQQPGIPLNDLDLTTKSSIFLMIDMAASVGAVPPFTVPQLHDANGVVVTDEITGDPVLDWDAADLDGYFRAHAELVDPQIACTSSSMPPEQNIVATTNAIHELLGYAWALAAVSGKDVLARNPWLLSAGKGFRQ